MKLVWFADYATGAASCSELRSFWDDLVVHDAEFGYFPNASKTHLMIKEQFVEKARALFASTGISITTQGKRHLGAAIGSNSFHEEHVEEKVLKWV